MREKVRTPYTKTRFLTELFELFCCYFLSVATFMTINCKFDDPLSISKSFIYPAIILAVIYFVTRRALNAIILSSAAFVAFAVFVFSHEKPLPLLFRTIRGFIKWSFGNYKIGVENVPKAFTLIFILTYILICSAIFVLVFILRKNYITFPLTAAIFFISLFINASSVTVIVAMLLIVGFFPLLADKVFSQAKSDTQFKKKLNAIVSSLIISAVLSGAILYALDGAKSFFHLRFFSDLVADFQSDTQLYTQNQRKETSNSLKSLNLQGDGGRISGNLNPVESTNVLAEVDDYCERLFKVTSFDYFSGTNWKQAENKCYRLDNKYHEKMDEHISYLSQTRKSTDFLAGFINADIKVNIRTPSKFLFTSSNIFNFREQSVSNNTIMFSDRGEIYSYWKQANNYTYSYSTYQYFQPEKKYEDDVCEFIDSVAYANAQGLSKEFTERYTQLPKYWSLTLQKRAKLAAVKNRPFQTAIRIMDALNSFNIQITDTPGEVEKTLSPVDQMLRDKKGNCVQYATAYCLMLRSLGIPARLAVGYTSTKTDKEGKYCILPQNRYAWTEIYLDGIGWFDLDPLDKRDNYKFNTKHQSSMKQEPPPEEVPEEVHTGDTDEINDIAPDEKEKKTLVQKLLPYIIVLSCLIGLVLLRMILSLIFSSRLFINLRYRDKNRRLYYYDNDILNGFKLLGVSTEPTDTLDLILSKANRYVDTPELTRLFKRTEQIYYGREKASGEDIHLARTVKKQVNSYLSRNISKGKYIFRRKLFKPFIVLRKYK